MEDLIYFRKSGGGITLSGGEPLLQIEFVKALLENCREYNIGTAVETCGDVPWSSFKMIDGLVDFYLYDIKHMDDNYHKRYTGAGNKRILENLKRLSKCDKTIFLRLPLIDCFNLDEEEAHMIGKLTGELNIAEVHLLPYHRLGEKKYAQLSIPYLLQGEKDVMSKQTGRKRVERFAEIIRLYNKNVHVGG
jgi:pyruvate formate lyase activating enzyme